MVQVTPPTMALATDGQWRTTAEAFQNFLNTTVAYPIQIFSTTQAFPTEEYLAHYENRLTDPDVQANPHLQTLIEEYIAWYTAEMSQRKMTIRDHYIVVPVTPAEVQFERESVTQQLAKLPVVGLLVQAWFAPRSEEEFDAMGAELLTASTGREGIREIEGCSAQGVDADEMATLLASFWNGEIRDEGEMGERIRNDTAHRRDEMIPSGCRSSAVRPTQASRRRVNPTSRRWSTTELRHRSIRSPIHTRVSLHQRTS